MAEIKKQERYIQTLKKKRKKGKKGKEVL